MGRPKGSTESNTFVTDRDMGMDKKLDLLFEADGLLVRAGWLSGAPRYPEERGGTAIAKVAGVQFATHMSRVWDRDEARLDGMIGAAERAIYAGASAKGKIGEIARDMAQRLAAEVHAVGLIEDGYLIDQIKAGLYAMRTSAKSKSGFGRPRLLQEFKGLS